MTFERFLEESQVGYSTIETRDDLHFVIQKTWNAAIKAAIWEARVAVAMEGETIEIQVQDAVRKLLTSK